MDSSDEIPPDMRAALEKFEQELDEITQVFANTLESIQPPPLIWHYTNDFGLKGIVETGRFQLTDIFNLNDPSELRHGFSLASEILTRVAASGPQERTVFAKEFADFEGHIPQSGHFFICCFSSSGNDLGQWRAYADNGRGYALGFDAKALEAAFGKEASDSAVFPTFPVTYEDAQLKTIYNKLVEKALDLISLPDGKDLDEAVIRSYWTELHNIFITRVLLAGMYFKHEAYNNEQEYRFLQLHGTTIPTCEMKWKARSYSLFEYREFDWRSVAPGALKEIVIGPAADPERARLFVTECLRLFHNGNVGGIKILDSGIPYRAV